MEPVTIAAIVAGTAALAQLYNAEKARGASADRLRELQGLYDRIKPPTYDLSIQDPPELHAREIQKPEFSPSQKDVAPSFDMAPLTPEDYKLLEKYVPEVAPQIFEAAPKTVERTATGASARDAQLRALQRYADISESGFDPILGAQQAEAAHRAQTEAQSRQASILQDFARRGQSGSGLQLAAQMGGAADAMERQALTSGRNVEDAYRRRMDALAQGTDLAGQVESRDIGLQERNAAILNAFNERAARAQQEWAQKRATAMSAANLANVQAAQGVADKNVTARNQARGDDRTRMDALKKYLAEFQREDLDREDANKKWAYEADVAQRDAENNISLKNAQWKSGERDRLDRLRQQAYADQLQRAGLAGGVLNQITQSDISRAQDQNQAIQGAVGAVGAYAQGKQNRDQARWQSAQEDDRAQYERSGKWMSEDERKKRYGEDPYL